MKSVMQNLGFVCWIISLGLVGCQPGWAQSDQTQRPNVIFIAIDDQNDWIGTMGGHPMAKTPNMDQLAARGTVFLNAHCQAPLCNPSRTSVMLGRRPSSTGIYGLAPWFRDVETLADRVTLAQHFHDHSYKTLVAGKIFHGGPSPATRSKEFDVWGPGSSVGITPSKKLIPPTPMGNHPLMDWGTFPHNDQDKGDYQIASWAIEQIQQHDKGRPFFLATGFFLPHVPCYATPSCFELYPDDDTILPSVLDSDRDDVPRFAWYLHWELPEPRLRWVRDNGQWRNLVRSYLACTSFVDAQIGRVVQAVEQAGLAENTIIVVWGDHGWHLGEKGITGKNTLWERSTRIPLIFAGPGIAQGGRCEQPAELLDLYPTLIELCNLTQRDDLEGVSLRPQLINPQTIRERPAITTHNQGNHSVRSLTHRYIRYADGSQELYNLKSDPHEWQNLANQPSSESIIAEHRKWLPQVNLPPAPKSAHRILLYDPVSDEANWEGTVIQRSSVIPE